MEFKKVKADQLAVTRNLNEFVSHTGNLYETVVALSRRSNQIGAEIKEELNSKIEEFTTTTDNLEEIYENREQIEIAKYYEKLPKPTLIAIAEYLSDQLYIRNPLKEENEMPL